MEVRGLGIVELAHQDNVPVALIVELTSDIQRLPEDSRERLILGVGLPFVTIDAMPASAPAKVDLALDRFGLKF
jgi:serine kinase of HPr protein (carbohydrate metabolism regulator)